MNARIVQGRPVAAGALDFLVEDSDAARILRSVDWASTSIGDPSTWSPTLKVLTRFILAQRFPMLLWWGPDYIQIYNDAYSPILGGKHPWGMGQPLHECWSEIWDVLKPLVDTPYNGGPATWMEDIELGVKRRGFLEESHFTIAYSPVHDEAAPRGMGGVLATVHEITEKVIGQRRVALLRELGAGISGARTDHDACRAAADILAKYPKDIPFALLYLIDSTSCEPRFVCGTGIPPEGFDAVVGGAWPLAEALQAEQPQVVEHLAGIVQDVPSGPYPEPPISAVVIPIKSNVANRPAGVLVAGVSSRIRLDSEYSGFFDLVSAQIATAIANARAYDEERRRAVALAELDRAKITFFSNISHEFRTPLTLMLGPLEQALADTSLSPGLHEQIDLARRNSQRLLKLVNSLLNFARIESGRVRARYEPVDLASLTTDLASNFRSAMERAGLRFDVRSEEFTTPVYVDPDMWEKIVLNLISNAFKFTLQGLVSVTVTTDGRHAVLEVADTGVGVPEHELPRLFDRFYRVEGTQGRTHEGSGIGLALVQELVRLHGGTIDVESTLGEGTRFRVRLPLGNSHLPAESIHTAQTQSSTAISAQAYVQEALRWLPSEQGKVNTLLDVAAQRDQRFASTYGARIVLADDNADMREYLQTLLGANYEVEAVADGAQALAAIRRKRPDLVLSDVMMPQVDGFGLIQALRADDALRDVAVILLSARAGEESRIEGLNAGADDFIVKPFIARELLARIGALLELRRLRKDVDGRFQAFVEATSDVVYRMNPDWTEMRELRGRNLIADTDAPRPGWLQKYIYPDDQQQVMAAVDESVRRKVVFQLEHRVIRRDGTVGWVFSRAIPLIDESGALTEWIGAASDITARRLDREALVRQQHELEAADQQKNEFLAMLAHELRNPLAPIRNSGEVLARTLPNDSIALGAVHMIERQVTHLTRLVDDLLDVSRITQGRIELRRQNASVAELVSRALETVGPLAQRKQQRVIATPARTSMTVNVDPERIVQCLANVLTNANKFAEFGGEIRVETSNEGGYARIVVADDGVGVSPELLPRVFDLFVQGTRTLDRSQGGLGIGLSIVKRLVDMHGGDVAIESAGEGMGTRVTIRLPLTETASDTAGTTAVPKPKPRRILVVDDNEDAANSLAMVLAIDGHETATAFNGLQALERTNGFKPDVVLLDIGLPGIDGYEVAHRIRAASAGRNIRLVALTGYGQDEDREKARLAGFADHLVKPVEYATLQRAIAETGAAPLC